MDTQKITTVIVWATIVLVAYEAYKAVAGGSSSTNPLGTSTSTGNATLDGELMALGVGDFASGSNLSGSQPAVNSSGGLTPVSTTDFPSYEDSILGGY